MERFKVTRFCSNLNLNCLRRVYKMIFKIHQEGVSKSPWKLVVDET